jgi:PKD repeat protein
MPRAGVWWNFGSGTANYSTQSDTSMLSFGFGTDNVVTTPTDLTKLVNAILNNQLLNAQSKTEMMTWVPQSYVNQWTAGYGLGMHHFLNQSVDTLLGHDGKFCNQSDVFHSSICGFTLAAMTNSETFWEGIYQSMYDVLRNYYQCNTVPVANFVASDRAFCAGGTVTFSDSSTNWRPTAWNWNFPGGTLVGGTTITDSMPQVMYSTPGVYAVSYTASTLGGSDAVTKNGYITVNSSIASYSVAFTESFETATLPNADWSINNTASLDWAVTSIGAATGTKSVYIDNYSNTAGNKSSLISTAFDISGFITPKLTFKMAYQQKVPTNAEKLQVYTSTDCGATWVLRLTKQGSGLATVTPPSPVPLIPGSSQFNTYTVNINGVAGSPNVRFRFDFTADPSAPGNYIFLDDINIFDASVGIKTNSAEFGLNIYPNPASGVFNLNSAEIMDEVTVKDVLGRVVYNVKPNEKNISLALENDGLYFVTVKAGAQGVTQKLLVKH